MRGYNQAFLLAKHLSQQAQQEGIPLPSPHKNLLQRLRKTPSQARISDRRQRLQNVRGAFALASGVSRASLTGKRFWIVDDVSTGATLRECGRVLKQAGAREVWGIAIAR